MGWGVTCIYTVNGTYKDGECSKTGNGTVINTTFNDALYQGNGSYPTRGAGLSGSGGSSGSSSGGGWIPQYLMLYDGFAIDPLAAKPLFL